MAVKASTIKKILFLTLSVVMLGVWNVGAQTTISKEFKESSFSPDSSYYLGDWVVEGSLIVLIDGEEVTSSEWEFQKQDGIWRLKEEARSEYSNTYELIIRYQVYPLTIQRSFHSRPFLRLDSSFYDQESDSLSRELINRSQSSAFNDSDLQQRGSLSRGIIVGSNQDFALESGLNFELSGQLTDDITINASLTDRSIPIQPDGTTQNLREFDRVFIQLQAPNTRIEMGDVDVSLQQSTFSQLNRRLQGAAGYTSTRYGDYTGALSVVRGTYKSMSFQGRDGVQGPYRLTGRGGEEFVIILAGTERVYINGQQVARGEENEYIIDYGLGEVFFTNNLLIKDETRIVIEYEYIDQNFNRTLVAAEAGDEFLSGRLKIGASVIRQADGDELLSQQTLTEDDIEVLREVGDDLDQAVVSGARLADEEDESNIRYAQIDTTYNGQVYSIYKNIPGTPESKYIVRFSKVEEGTGSYRRVSGSVNGLLYEWVGPGNGDYAPFRELPAPEQQQMVALNTSFALNDNIELFGEWAASSLDQNRFSALDDDDNNDFSYLSGLKVENLETSLGQISASASRRYTGQNFSFFERTREVEFDRKWNINRTGNVQEAINEASFQLSSTEAFSVGGEYGFIDRRDFKGYRQASFLKNTDGFVTINYQQDWVKSEDDILQQTGNWFRQSGSLSKSFGSITPYVSFEQEDKRERSSQTDSLRITSLAFYEVGPGFQFRKGAFDLDASVVYREEQGVLNNELTDESISIEQRYKIAFEPGTYFKTRNEVAIRSKEFTEEFELEGSTNREGLLIRSVTDYETQNEIWNGQLFYEANTRRQALLQEAYIEVGPGLGQFVWIDTNEDGVQQVDEFFPELSPNEGIYVRQYLPSDELFPVIDLKTRFRNEISPFNGVEAGSKAATFLKGITLRSRIDISENSTTEDLSDVYLLKLNTFRNDSTTIQGRLFWQKELDLFSNRSNIDLSTGYNESRNLNQRSTESQSAFSSLFFVNGSVQATDQIRVFSDLNLGTNRAVSDRLSSRNFDIRSVSLVPGIEVLFNRSWQSSFSLSYANKTDSYPVEDVTARILKFVNSHRAFLFRKIQANARIEFRNAEVEGNSSTFGIFELTDGTGEGTSILWSLSGAYRVSDLIRVSANYDGRTVRDRADIHTVKVVVSAVF